MKFKKVRTIIWDCDGTIWNHDPAEAFIFAKKMGLISKDIILEFEKQFFEAISCYNTRFQKEIVTQEKIIEIISEKIPILSYFGMSSKDFLEIWKNINTTRLNPGVKECMEFFQEKGFKNIVYTDWLKDSQIRLLKFHDLLQYIEEVHSSEGFYIKSSPKALPNRIVNPNFSENYLFIGDSKNDMIWAKKAKVDFVWFNPNSINIPGMEATLEISSFETFKKFF